jgi:hypothetical protein
MKCFETMFFRVRKVSLASLILLATLPCSPTHEENEGGIVVILFYTVRTGSVCVSHFFKEYTQESRAAMFNPAIHSETGTGEGSPTRRTDIVVHNIYLSSYCFRCKGRYSYESTHGHGSTIEKCAAGLRMW